MAPAQPVGNVNGVLLSLDVIIPGLSDRIGGVGTRGYIDNWWSDLANYAILAGIDISDYLLERSY